MRKRLVLLILATTVLVVVALIVPLGLLVRDQAADSAKVAAESDAQQVAGLVALALAVNDDPGVIAEAVGELPSGTIVVFESGDVIGVGQVGQGDLALTAIATGSTVADSVPGGWEVAVPVLGVDATVAVDSFVSDADLSEGVLGSWGLLALVGVVLVGVAVAVADRMGRGLVRPIEELAGSAHQLADGHIDTRVEPSDPDEIREMGEAFNYLASRLQELLDEERENVADLSHRLRTPLTSARLQAETLGDDAEREAMLSQIDRVEKSMNDLIALARSGSSDQKVALVLDDVVESRIGYWRVLADEQGRDLVLSLGAPEGTVLLSRNDVVAVVDNLMANVFSYTPAGSAISVSTSGDNSSVWLEVADRGPGFGSKATERGVSGAGSTGLGLDIVKKTATVLEVDDRPGGGAVVKASFEKI